MSSINNTQTLNALRHLNKTTESESSSTRKLSSGSRITRASDDAAGLALSEKIKAKTRSRGQAIRNANDAVSIVQTVEGGLHELNAMIIRMRELTVHAASDTVSGNERVMMNTEARGLLKEIDRIAQSQEIFGKKLTVGNQETLDIQVDAGNSSADKIKIDLSDLAQTSTALGIFDVSIDTKLRANVSMFKLDHALNEVGRSMARMGAVSSRLGSTVRKLQGDVQTGKSANSKIRDVDYASETAKRVRDGVVKDAQTSVLSQTNTSNSQALKLVG